MSISVSAHAIERHIERFGGDISKRAHKIDSIRRCVAFGIELFPKSTMIKLLNNGCKNARYYLNGQVVAVVEESTVVTVYPYEASKFKPFNEVTK